MQIWLNIDLQKKNTVFNMSIKFHYTKNYELSAIRRWKGCCLWMTFFCPQMLRKRSKAPSGTHTPLIYDVMSEQVYAKSHHYTICINSETTSNATFKREHFAYVTPEISGFFKNEQKALFDFRTKVLASGHWSGDI